jgi:hypothetical protein
MDIVFQNTALLSTSVRDVLNSIYLSYIYKKQKMIKGFIKNQLIGGIILSILENTVQPGLAPTLCRIYACSARML